MIAAGVLLLSVGSADVARQFLGRGSRRGRVLVSAATVLVICAVATGVLPWPLAAGLAAVSLAWLALMPSTRDAAIAGFWPAIGLAVAVALLVSFSPGDAAGWADRWWTEAVAHVPPLAKIVLVLGVGVFLLESANIVVRVALQSERAEGDVAPPAAAERSAARGLLARLRRPVPVEVPPPMKQLKGGRLIGPLERLFMVGLIFTSAVALLAAFVAAKGIVRFPEIQKDNARGTQAEYFLVGSMTSWAIALAAAGLLWAVDATPRDFGIS